MSPTSTALTASQPPRVLERVALPVLLVVVEIVAPGAVVVVVVGDVVPVRAAVVETPAEAHLRVAAIAKLHPGNVCDRVTLRRGPFVLQERRTP